MYFYFPRQTEKRDRRPSLIPNFLPLTNLNHRSNARTIFSSICVLLLMLTTYFLFPTAAGNMETRTERAESPPHCLMLASQPGRSSVRTFLPPKPGAPHQGGAQTFKEEKQVARSTAKLGKVRQTASRDRQSNLNTAKWKADSPEGRGNSCYSVSSSEQPGFQLFVDNKSWQGWGRATAFISSPVYTADWERAPSSSP